jgi:hypothetical protein
MIRISRTFGVAAAGIALAASVTAAPAGFASTARAPAGLRASSVDLTFLSTTAIRVKDSHRRALHLSIGANRGQRGTDTATVTLSDGKPYVSGETHTWTFDLKRSAFSAHAGKATLVTKTMLKSFGTITLSFAKRSTSSSACQPVGTVTRMKGTVTGTIYFNTRTGPHGWGTIGSRTHKVRIKGASVLTLLGTGCPLGSSGGSTACVRGISWSPPFVSGTTSSFFGVEQTNGHAVSTITVNNQVRLSSPAGASRNDDLIAKEPRPTLKGGILQIRTSGSLVTGAASITSTGHNPNPYSCTSRGKKKTQKTQDYTGTWSSSKLEAHFAATGVVEAPTAGAGSFTTLTF